MKTLLLFFVLAGCFSGYGQIVSDSFMVDGNYRTFHFIPEGKPSYSDLVFVLHGSGSSGKAMMERTVKMREIARAENALLVYPDGYKNYWNECRKRATSLANTENINEEDFFKGMIGYFEKHYQINPQNVFVVGSSGGGHMAYKLGITLPHMFRAIAALIANLPDDSNMDCPSAAVPISVMIANGTEDKTNPYNGGEMGALGNGITLGSVRSTDQTLAFWATLAGYTGKPRKKLLPDLDPADGKRVERYTYRKKNKPEIVLFKVIGGQHNYPNDIDIFIEAWQFFKRQK